MTGTPDLARRTTVDDYLGDGARRFFGAGYKRAEQRLTGLTVTPAPDGAGTITARAAVSYPTDWSRKGRNDQLPHLSSIDALLIAGEIADVYLTHTHQLSDVDRRSVWLRRIRLKSGRAPVEQELPDFPISATARPGPAAPDGRAVTVVDCQVGALRAELDVDHPAGEPRPAEGSYPTPDALLGPAGPRPYAAAHKAKRQRIEELDVDVEARVARAMVDVAVDGAGAVTGLESHSHHAISVIDAFVATIQLGQILLYELDRIDRAGSNTLWMRQTVLDIGSAGTPVSGPAALRVWLENDQLLRRDPTETWRAADIVGHVAGVDIRCSAAHRLPGNA